MAQALAERLASARALLDTHKPLPLFSPTTPLFLSLARHIAVACSVKPVRQLNARAAAGRAFTLVFGWLMGRNHISGGGVMGKGKPLPRIELEQLFTIFHISLYSPAHTQEL